MARRLEGDPLGGRAVSQDRAIAGRDRELARLHAALDEAIAGRGRTVLVTGEPGIGKTTLAEAFSDEARGSAARVVWGRCWEGGGAPAYWPWVQVIRDALALPDVIDELTSVRSFLDVVATLVPEIAGLGALDNAREVEGERERFVLFDAIARVLEAIGREIPLVVVLDDIHEADASSLLLLRFIARDIRSSRCLVIGTYRDREVEADPIASEILTGVAREGEVLPLGGLDADTVATVLEQTAGTRPSGALMSALHDITEGNPFYANEILRLLQREGQLETRLDLSRHALPVPDSVRDTVLRRVRALDPETKRLLEVASVIGREFAVDVLAAASNIEVEDVRTNLAAACSERIVQPLEDGSYVFAHGLIREALYENLADGRRAELHAAVASVLEERGLHAGGENLAEIAHHYLRASLDDPGPAYGYAVRAARRALDVLAYEQAAELFEEALPLFPRVGASHEEKSDVLRAFGEALLWAGRITEAKECLVEAADEARTAGSSELLAAAAITYGNITIEGGIVNEDLVAMTSEALDKLGSGPSRERAFLLGRWGHELAVSVHKDDALRRDRMTAEALAMMRLHGDELDVARALRFRFVAIFAPNRLDECMQVADEITRLGVSTRDAAMQLMGRTRRAIGLMAYGRAPELDAELIELQRLVDEVRAPILTSPVAFFHACLTGIRADVTSALQESDAALAAAPEIPNAMVANFLQHLTWRWQTDGAGELESFVREAMDQRPGIRRLWHATLANTLARGGRIAEARVFINDVLAELDDFPLDLVYLTTLHGAIDALRILKRPDGAEELYDALYPYRDQHIFQPMAGPVLYYGAAEWDLGTLASLLERWDAAEEHFEKALVEHSRMGARTFLAWTQVELAEMLIRRGDRADAERARTFLREGLATAEELGLAMLTRFAEPITSQEAARPSERGRRGGSASMVREGEYITITSGDEVVRLRDSKGLAYLATLLVAPGRELHVLEIATPGASVTPAGSGELELGKDNAGPALDPKAKLAYKQRIDELRADIEEAEAFNDPVRAANAKEELAFLTEELAGAVGLGGRDRKTASNVERARVNLTKRIKTTIDKISADAPELGRHLEATIKTGTYLSYSDRLEPTLDWEIRA